MKVGCSVLNKAVIGGKVKIHYFVCVLWGLALVGCGTINADRESYMKDAVYEKERYFGDAVSEPAFSRYELRGKYEVDEEKLNIHIDPVEIYTQEKEEFVVRRKVSYERYGPYGYSPGMCVFKVVMVFDVLFSMIDDDNAEDLQETCDKGYEWKREEQEQPPEKTGVKTVELLARNYQDSSGSLVFQLRADGKRVNKVNLTGFRGKERRGPYSWTVNSWYDFSRLEDDDSLAIEIINRRGKVALDKTLAIAKEDAESVIFKSKYDGIFQLYYTCRLCNANLTDNFYTDARRIIWYSNVYLYKGKGSLDFVASCIEDRFDRLRHGDVRVMRANTPKGRNVWPDIYSSYGTVRGVKAPDEPTVDDLQSCIRKKRLDLEIKNYYG